MDFTDGDKKYHPNVSGDKIKSDKRALKYISKEDPEPLEWPAPFIKAETEAKEGHRKILTKRIITESIPLTDLVE